MDKHDFFVTVKVKATGFDLTSAIETYAREKVAMLERFLKHLQSKSHEVIFEVEVARMTAHHKQGEVYRVEIMCSSGGEVLRAEATDEDMYAAIDGAKAVLQGRLSGIADKDTGMMRKAGRFFKGLMRRG